MHIFFQIFRLVRYYNQQNIITHLWVQLYIIMGNKIVFTAFYTSTVNENIFQIYVIITVVFIAGHLYLINDILTLMY